METCGDIVCVKVAIYGWRQVGIIACEKVDNYGWRHVGIRF